MAYPKDPEQIAFWREAEPVIAESQAKHVFLAIKLPDVAYAADKIPVESFEEANGSSAIKRAHIGAR